MFAYHNTYDGARALLFRCSQRRSTVTRPAVKDAIIHGLAVNMTFASDGVLIPTFEAFSVSKLELTQQFGFELRDLRILRNCNVTHNTASVATAASYKFSSPTFWIRQKAFISHFNIITALISADKCYLFNVSLNDTRPERESGYDSDSEDALVRSGSFDILSKMKAKLQSSMMFNNLSFEFHCLEAVIKSVVSKYRYELFEIERECNVILNDTNMYNMDKSLELNRLITSTKIELIETTTNVKSCIDAIHEVLNNQEDLNLMYLAENNRGNQVNHDKQLELLLENYSWQLDEIIDRSQLLLDEITMYERSIGFVINKQRNEIIRMNLKLSVLTCAFGCGALSASVFGMNLVSHLESNPYAFWMTALSFSALVPFSIYRHFKVYLNSRNIPI